MKGGSAQKLNGTDVGSPIDTEGFLNPQLSLGNSDDSVTSLIADKDEVEAPSARKQWKENPIEKQCPNI